MTFEEIEALARSYTPISPLASLTEKKCHLCLQHLYYLFRTQAIDRETASKEKRAIRQVFLSDSDTDQRALELRRQLGRTLISGQELTAKVLKAGSRQEMLDLSLQCIAAMTDDNVFYLSASKRLQSIGEQCGYMGGE